MKSKLFHNIIQYNSILSLLLCANTKRCFTHYFGARIYSPPIQRKGSREIYCFSQSIMMWGNAVSHERGEGTRFAFTVWEEAANRCDCSAKSIARLSCCPLLPSWKANSCTGLKRCCQRSGLSLASVCHPRTVMRSENSWCSLVFLQDQCFPGVAWECCVSNFCG